MSATLAKAGSRIRRRCSSRAGGTLCNATRSAQRRESAEDVQMPRQAMPVSRRNRSPPFSLPRVGITRHAGVPPDPKRSAAQALRARASEPVTRRIGSRKENALAWPKTHRYTRFARVQKRSTKKEKLKWWKKNKDREKVDKHPKSFRAY